MAPSLGHEELRDLISNVAILMGFEERVPCLPDRSVPDTLRRSADGGIFIGDAKWTESALCRESYLRLANYADWLSIAANRAPGKNAFALAFGIPGETASWKSCMEFLLESRFSRYSTVEAIFLGPHARLLIARV